MILTSVSVANIQELEAFFAKPVGVIDGQLQYEIPAWLRELRAAVFVAPLPCAMCDWIKGASLHPRYAQERYEGPGHDAHCKRGQ